MLLLLLPFAVAVDVAAAVSVAVPVAVAALLLLRLLLLRRVSQRRIPGGDFTSLPCVIYSPHHRFNAKHTL